MVSKWLFINLTKNINKVSLKCKWIIWVVILESLLYILTVF